MTPSRPLRSVRLLATALAVVAAATACNGIGPVGPSPVATVNGHEITLDDVRAQVTDAEAYLELAGPAAEKQRAKAESEGQQVISKEELAQQVREQTAAYAGAGTHTLGTVGTARELERLIQVEIYRDALKATGAKVTTAQREAARKAVYEAQVTGYGLEAKDLPKDLFATNIEVQAISEAIRATAPVGPDDEERAAAAYEQTLRDAYDAQVDDYSQLCLRLIVAADQATGEAAVQRLEAGEELAAVAADLSSQPDAADADECVARADVAGVIPEAATAESGDVIGPAESQGQFLVAKVSSIDVPQFEDVRAQLEQNIPDTGAQAADEARSATLEDALAAAFERADVELDPRFGTWDPETGTLTPPEDPAVPEVTFPGSNEPTPATDPASDTAGS